MSTNEQLAREAAEWSNGTRTLQGWRDAPEAAPQPTTAISIRIPDKMLAILKEFAQRKGIGYQVLMKRWLRDRIEQEARLYLKQAARGKRIRLRELEGELLEHAPKEVTFPGERTSPVFHEAGEAKT